MDLEERATAHHKKWSAKWRKRRDFAGKGAKWEKKFLRRQRRWDKRLDDLDRKLENW